MEIVTDERVSEGFRYGFLLAAQGKKSGRAIYRELTRLGWRDLNKVSNKPMNSQLQIARGCNNRMVNGVPAAQIVVSGYMNVTTTTIVRKKKTTTTTREPHGFLLTPQ